MKTFNEEDVAHYLKKPKDQWSREEADTVLGYLKSLDDQKWLPSHERLLKAWFEADNVLLGLTDK